MQRISVLFTIVFLLVSCSGCSGDPITVVKNGTLDNIDKSVTVGNALGNYKYFSKTKWATFQDDQKRNVVEFVGTVDMDRLIQALYTDEKSLKDAKDSLTRFLKDQKVTINDLATVKLQFLLNADMKGFDINTVEFKFNNEVQNTIFCPVLPSLLHGEPISCISFSIAKITEEYKKEEDDRIQKIAVDKILKGMIGKYSESDSRYDAKCYLEMDIKDMTLNNVNIDITVFGRGACANSFTKNGISIPLKRFEYNRSNGDFLAKGESSFSVEGTGGITEAYTAGIFIQNGNKVSLSIYGSGKDYGKLGLSVIHLRKK